MCTHAAFVMHGWFKLASFQEKCLFIARPTSLASLQFLFLCDAWIVRVNLFSRKMLVFSKAYFVALASIEKHSNASSILARHLAMHPSISTGHRVFQHDT
jgi:hypothetical protein